MATTYIVSVFRSITGVAVMPISGGHLDSPDGSEGTSPPARASRPARASPPCRRRKRRRCRSGSRRKGFVRALPRDRDPGHVQGLGVDLAVDGVEAQLAEGRHVHVARRQDRLAEVLSGARRVVLVGDEIGPLDRGGDAQRGVGAREAAHGIADHDRVAPPRCRRCSWPGCCRGATRRPGDRRAVAAPLVAQRRAARRHDAETWRSGRPARSGLPVAS